MSEAIIGKPNELLEINDDETIDPTDLEQPFLDITNQNGSDFDSDEENILDSATFHSDEELDTNEGDQESPDPRFDRKKHDLYKSHPYILTFRALILGCLIGGVVGAMNVNFGLRTGWTQGGGIFAAIIAIGVMKIISPIPAFTPYEAVIAVTAASSAGTMTSAAGLVSAIPALQLLGKKFTATQLIMWAISIAYFGVFFAVPIRKQMLVVEKLRFPSGMATAETIKAMFAKGALTIRKANVLLITAVTTSIYSLISFFIPWIEEPPIWSGFEKYGFTLYINPLLLGGGMLSGLRATSSLLAGSIVGWGIIGPIINAKGLVENTTEPTEYNGIRGWILWVGVSIMTSDSFIQLLFSIPTIFSGCVALIKRLGKKPNAQATSIQKLRLKELEQDMAKNHYIPWWWWVLGLIFSTVLLTFVGHFIFDLKFYFVWMAIPISFLLSIIAARCVGETDINPVGGMGKVTQLIFAGLAPGNQFTNLLSAGVVAAGASQCGDMMQDLKMGYEIGVSPRKQFIAQCLGIICGVFFVVPLYKLYDQAYDIGGPEMPAPASHAWKAVAVLLSDGFGKLANTSMIWGVVAGVIFGVLLGSLTSIISLFNRKVASYFPSALAFGIGMIVPPKQSITMFVGALIHLVWRCINKRSSKNYFYAVSSGMIAGEGVMGIFIAILKVFKVSPLVKRCALDIFIKNGRC